MEQKFQVAVDECLVQISNKVGDAGPVLDVMTGMLENISTVTVIARTTVSAVYRAAQIVASLPNLSYQNKAFPEALFHQLLLAMVHPDHETRVGAHRIFSVVLVPSSVCPTPFSVTSDSNKTYDLRRTLSRTVSVFSSSAALFEKLRKDKFSVRENSCQENTDNMSVDGEVKSNNEGILTRLQSSYSRVHSVNGSPNPSTSGTFSRSKLHKELDPISLRLSSCQVTLRLSSIWAQSISPENTPRDYEAIAHTYSLLLLFSRIKLAFSLRSLALREGGPLQPSRRQSLFTLAISMIIFTSKAYNVLPLVSHAKALLTDKTADPFLRLVDDCKLEAVSSGSDHPIKVYGTEEDDNTALKSLISIEITEDQSKESLASTVLMSFLNLANSEASSLREQLLNEFVPDDVCPLGSQIFMEAPKQNSQYCSQDNESVDKAMYTSFIEDDDIVPEAAQSHTNPNMEMVMEFPDLLSVNQLLESVLETACQVGRFSVSTAPDVPYKEMASHCEALLTGKQQKMSSFIHGQQKQEHLINTFSVDRKSDVKELPDLGLQKSGNPFIEQRVSTDVQRPSIGAGPMICATEYQQHPHIFRLPASSPYDNFLKAAGC